MSARKPGFVLAASLALLALPRIVHADAFAGTWQAKLTPDEASAAAGAKTFDDALIFEQNQLLTEGFAFLGFNPGAYVIPEGQTTRFTASLDSNVKGTLAWSGSVSGGTISGTLTWTKADGTVWRYTYAGTKRAE